MLEWVQHTYTHARMRGKTSTHAKFMFTLLIYNSFFCYLNFRMEEYFLGGDLSYTYGVG
jgi:hypothetical protein